MVDLVSLIASIAPQLTYGIGLILGLVLIRLIHRAGKKAGVPGLHAIRDILTIIWAAFAGLAVLRFASIPGIDLTTLSFSAILGLAFSLALQTTLQNMIAGLLLFRDKAIRLNDEISC